MGFSLELDVERMGLHGHDDCRWGSSWSPRSGLARVQVGLIIQVVCPTFD